MIYVLVTYPDGHSEEYWIPEADFDLQVRPTLGDPDNTIQA